MNTKRRSARINPNGSPQQIAGEAQAAIDELFRILHEAEKALEKITNIAIGGDTYMLDERRIRGFRPIAFNQSTRVISFIPNHRESVVDAGGESFTVSAASDQGVFSIGGERGHIWVITGYDIKPFQINYFDFHRITTETSFHLQKAELNEYNTHKVGLNGFQGLTICWIPGEGFRILSAHYGLEVDVIPILPSGVRVRRVVPDEAENADVEYWVEISTDGGQSWRCVVSWY